jgi:hypothetical protein
MPLGVLLLNHFTDDIPLLEAQCRRCNKQWIYRTKDLVADHGAFVSMPALRRIVGIGCPLLTMHQDACELSFPQVDRMFSHRLGGRKAADLER